MPRRPYPNLCFVAEYLLSPNKKINSTQFRPIRGVIWLIGRFSCTVIPFQREVVRSSNHRRRFFFCWASCNSPLLGRSRSRADVEQPFDCCIIQNRQVVQSTDRSMDWSVKDNMIDDLFFCTTHTRCRKRPHPVCTSRSAKVRHRCGGG